MRVISAVLLAKLGGKENPDANDVKKILGSVGIEAAADDVQRLFKELEGKDVAELIAAGREKLQAIPSGGGGGGAAAAPAAGGGGGAAPAKEEKKEEPSEADEDMGFSLFD